MQPARQAWAIAREDGTMLPSLADLRLDPILGGETISEPRWGQRKPLRPHLCRSTSSGSGLSSLAAWYQPGMADEDRAADSGSETADGSNYRVTDEPGSAVADGSNYRDDESDEADTADGSNYRVSDDDRSETADGSNYRDEP